MGFSLTKRSFKWIACVAEFTGILMQDKFFVSKIVFFHSSSFLPMSVNISSSFQNDGGEGNVFLLCRM